jgi:molybdopterin-containing oxidoreductase family membrane subunit
MIAYLKFWIAMIKYAAKGGVKFYAWNVFLLALIAFGGFHYHEHLVRGLVVTNMTDQVSWGIGIANFVYLVGLAAAAALLVTPAYVYHRKDIKEVVLIGEVLAFCSIVLCLLFIITDVGRPDRLWHLIPPFGRINLPSSLLSWDVVVFNGYILLNLHIPGYLLWKRYSGVEPKPLAYVPFVFVSIGWAVSIHVVTAFLLSGLGSRHFWNTAILAPRFLISAGASGPAILTFVFLAIRRNTEMWVRDSVFEYLLRVLKITMPINLFLLGCEIFHEFYTGTLGAASARYLYFGLEGHNSLTKIIWTAIAMNTTATYLFLRQKTKILSPPHLVGCGLTICGIWIEKGMGLIFPGFTPSPLGEIVEYVPSLGEVAVGVGVLAFGLLLFTLMVKVVTGIQTGKLRAPGVPERSSLMPSHFPPIPPSEPSRASSPPV